MLEQLGMAGFDALQFISPRPRIDTRNPEAYERIAAALLPDPPASAFAPHDFACEPNDPAVDELGRLLAPKPGDFVSLPARALPSSNKLPWLPLYLGEPEYSMSATGGMQQSIGDPHIQQQYQIAFERARKSQTHPAVERATSAHINFGPDAYSIGGGSDISYGWDNGPWGLRLGLGMGFTNDWTADNWVLGRHPVSTFKFETDFNVEGAYEFKNSPISLFLNAGFGGSFSDKRPEYNWNSGFGVKFRFGR
jgi:hypothetical protein